MKWDSGNVAALDKYYGDEDSKEQIRGFVID